MEMKSSVTEPPTPHSNVKTSPPNFSSSKIKIEDSLKLEELDTNLFRCVPENLWRPMGSRGVFGGQIVGLCLSSASKTVGPQFKIQSLHSYFLLPGDSTRPILFHVSYERDSSSFATRRVSAIQHGKSICLLLCSFMKGEPRIIQHQETMPQVPEPETLVSYKDAMLAQLDQVPKHLQALVQASLKEPISVDLRPCRYPRPNDFYLPKRRRPRQLYWFKTSQPIPNDPHLHMSIAAYLSDHQLLWTSLLPYGYTRLSQPHVSMLVSLDHAMWFHTDFRVDEWMLYEMESPRACGSRGWTYGKVWTRQGQCALTCTQEGLLRIQWDPQKPLASTHWETEEENENQREQKNLNVSTKQRGLTVGNETVTSSSTTIPINSSKWIENHLKQTSKL